MIENHKVMVIISFQKKPLIANKLVCHKFLKTMMRDLLVSN